MIKGPERYNINQHWAEPPGLRQTKIILGELKMNRFKTTRKLEKNYLTISKGHP